MVELRAKSALKSTRVLLAEDDPIMLSLIRDVLNVMGFGEVVVARDGRKALQDIMLQSFDLVFCDWLMPDMNGIEFTKAIRRLPDYEKCCVPIVMLTGKAMLEDVRTARDAGVNEYLIKPFSVDMLCTKIRAVIDHPRQYVLSDTYSGPDRRRKAEPEKIPFGKDRRIEKGILAG